MTAEWGRMALKLGRIIEELLQPFFGKQRTNQIYSLVSIIFRFKDSICQFLLICLSVFAKVKNKDRLTYRHDFAIGCTANRKYADREAVSV